MLVVEKIAFFLCICTIRAPGVAAFGITLLCGNPGWPPPEQKVTFFRQIPLALSSGKPHHRQREDERYGERGGFSLISNR
jgi:hypothetical protein